MELQHYASACSANGGGWCGVQTVIAVHQWRPLPETQIAFVASARMDGGMIECVTLWRVLQMSSKQELSLKAGMEYISA